MPEGRSRVSGNFNHGGGESLSSVSVDDEIKFESKDKVNVNADNNVTFLNISGDVSKSQGTGNVGASIALNNFNVKTPGAISNNDEGEASELVSLMYDKVKNFVNTNEVFGSSGVKNEGTISVKSIDVESKTDGAINLLSMAGSYSANENANTDNEGESADTAAAGMIESLINVLNTIYLICREFQNK